ncbi:hypothetical protein SGLAM104S_03379 [Streptomyces glaucescens]
MPLGVGDGWAASRHSAGGGARVTSAVLAHGAAEVRAHLVTGPAPGTPVRVTGWAAGDGLRAELLPLHGLSDTLTGVTGGDRAPGNDGATEGDGVPGNDGTPGNGTLFVALARLTADPDPAPLADTVTVRVDEGAGELEVRWSHGPALRVRLDADGADVRPV